MSKPLRYDSASAEMSACGRYRYGLVRVWDASKPGALFILLNPSTADGTQDDPTVRRCVGMAKKWGCGIMWIVNLFALRATNPRELLVDPDNAVGPQNDSYLNLALICFDRPADYIVCGWGNWGSHKLLRRRRDQVLSRLRAARTRCLSVNSTGDPKHPLYCKGDLVPLEYAPAILPEEATP